MKTLKTILMSVFIIVFSTGGASSGDAPEFVKNTYPEAAVDDAWADNSAVFNPEGALCFGDAHRQIAAFARIGPEQTLIPANCDEVDRLLWVASRSRGRGAGRPVVAG